MMSIGAHNYSSSVHLLIENDIPKAYGVTPRLFDRISKIASHPTLATPKYRFAVTGESLICLSSKNLLQDVDVVDPDTSSSLSTLFGNAPSQPNSFERSY